MSKKLLLINPVNHRRTGLAINATSRFPPLGLGIVAALTPDHWEVDIFDENFDQFEFASEQTGANHVSSSPKSAECGHSDPPPRENADLVGLTAFTATITRAYEIAGFYQKRGVPTVLGGIHASMLPEEALQYVDAVVIGEAESVWRQVIADFEAGEMRKTYHGELLDLKEMPRPRHDLFHPDYVFGSIQTARGCPMDCEFCSVTVFNGHQYRQRPVEEVLDELATIPQKMVFFVDDNVIGYSKQASDRAIALFNGMIERGIKKDWFCQASMNFAENDEVLARAAESGCRLVFIGVESENIAALKEVNKKLNLRKVADAYGEVFREINKHSIAVLGAFIYGMDSDAPEALRRRTDYISNSGVDVVQLTYLTPLPGTRLFSKLRDEDRLLYTNYPEDWDNHDMTEVTYRPLLMKPAELKELMHEGATRLYSRRSIWRKFIKTWRATRSFTTAMWAYSANTNYRNVGEGIRKFRAGLNGKGQGAPRG